MAEVKNLSKDVQFFVMRELARFRRPAQITNDVKEFFEIDITRQQINYYRQLTVRDLKPTAAQATKDLKTYFEDERQKFKKSIENIAGFHQPYRMQVLQEELEEELNKKYPLKQKPIVMDILKQMAEEVGGKYTNKRELTGANGQPLIPVEQMAVALFKNLLNKGLSEDEAADFSAKRYSVDKEKIIKSE